MVLISYARTLNAEKSGRLEETTELRITSLDPELN